MRFISDPILLCSWLWLLLRCDGRPVSQEPSESTEARDVEKGATAELLLSNSTGESVRPLMAATPVSEVPVMGFGWRFVEDTIVAGAVSGMTGTSGDATRELRGVVAVSGKSSRKML